MMATTTPISVMGAQVRRFLLDGIELISPSFLLVVGRLTGLFRQSILQASCERPFWPEGDRYGSPFIYGSSGRGSGCNIHG